MSAVDPLDLAVGAKAQRRSARRFSRLVSRSTSQVWASARWPFAGLIGLQVLGALALAGQVGVVKLTLDAILRVSDSGGGVDGLLLPVALLALLTAVTTTTTSLQTSLGRYVAEAVAAGTWQRVLSVATGAGLRSFESADFFDRLQRVQSSALSRPYQVTRGVITAAGAVAASVGLAVAIVALHPALLPLVLVGGLPVLLTSRRESKLEFDFTVAQTPVLRLRTYLTILQTGREEAKEVRAFGLAPTLRHRFTTLYAEYLGDLGAHLRRRLALSVAGNLGSAIVLAATLFALVWLVSHGEISVAAAGAALVAVRMLAGQVQGALSGIQSIFESGLFLDDLDRFVALGASTEESVDGGDPAPPLRVLTADRVSFTYPGRQTPALDEVSIEVREGEIVALVGENGSGKTTLAKLMGGLYEPDGGRVLWNGQDAQTFSPASRRAQVALIFQDFVRYALSASDNVTLGRPEAPEDPAEIRQAAEKAGAHAFIASLPAGYATPLSRLFAGGQELSGGQWQRVALARAFYRDAPLVVLDEPTAALDPRAESELFGSLRQVLAGRTALFISHRFSTVRTADRVYVLREGRVVEHGSHEELMALDGAYAELFRLQAAAYATSGHDAH